MNRRRFVTSLVTFVLLSTGCASQLKVVPVQEVGGAAPGDPDLATFEVTVSTSLVTDYATMYFKNAVMDLKHFIEQPNRVRTVWAVCVDVGWLEGRTQFIEGHPSWVIYYDPDINTVNINRDGTHITTKYKNEECHVYENGECKCDGPEWTPCGSLPDYVRIATALAVAARENATLQLEAEGYIVTDDP